MKNLLYTACLTLSLVSLDSYSMNSLQSIEILGHDTIADATVCYNQGRFFVNHEGNLCLVKGYDTDPLLRKMDNKQLKAFLDKNGYITVKKLSDDSYKLTAHARIKGGGPISGWIGYWGTKAVGYGTISLAATASIKAIAVKCGLVAGAKTAAVAAKTAMGVKGMATAIGEEVVEAAIGEAGAKTVMGSIMAHVPGAVFLTTKIEGAATFIGTGLAVCPWLP